MTPAPVYGRDVGPLAIAHRGGTGLAGENTVDAFRRSLALGIRYLETDVRLTSDGHVIAFHDARLGRVTGASGWVRSRTMGELTALPVRGGGRVAAFEELLTSFPDALVIVDVKEAAVVPVLARILQDLGCASRVCVAGIRALWLTRLHELVGAEVATAVPWRALASLATGSGLRVQTARFAHIPLRLGRVPVFRRDLLARAHGAGLRVIVWTVNDTITMHRLLDEGVDGIITDRPDLLREVLIARGQWRQPMAARVSSSRS